MLCKGCGLRFAIDPVDLADAHERSFYLKPLAAYGFALNELRRLRYLLSLSPGMTDGERERVINQANAVESQPLSPVAESHPKADQLRLTSTTRTE